MNKGNPLLGLPKDIRSEIWKHIYSQDKYPSAYMLKEEITKSHMLLDYIDHTRQSELQLKFLDAITHTVEDFKLLGKDATEQIE